MKPGSDSLLPAFALPESSVVSYHKAVLKNGVTLVAEQHPHVRSVSIGVWVRVGSGIERPSQNGISHFIEHMVFKGTENRSALEIATVLECLGGDLNAFTDREFTCFHATVLKEHVNVALDVISDLLIRPLFEKEQMERERKVLLQELSMIEDTPDDWINDVFLETIWKGEKLGQPVIGTKRTIQDIRRADLVRFFRQNYRAQNIVISVAGNIDFDETAAECERYFTFDGLESLAKRKALAPAYHAKKKAVTVNTEQSHLLIGFEGVGFKHPFRFDALILSFFLGGGMSSRLFQEIREKAGLAYSVECDCVPFTDTGVFTIYAALAPRSLPHCLQIVRREIERLKTGKLTEAELSIVKGQLKGTILMSSDQMETRQESLGRNELVFGRYVSVDEVLGEIDRVTPERLCEVARQLFVPEKETVITLGRTRPRPSSLTIF